MIPPLSYVWTSMIAASHIAVDDKVEDSAFDASERGFWLSFSVILYAAPIQLYLSLVRHGFLVQQNESAKAPIEIPTLSEHLLAESVSYLGVWVAFPLLMVLLTKLMEVPERYAPYIVARNWGVLLIYIVLGIPPSVLHRLGVIGTDVWALFSLVMFMIELWYLWRIAKMMLRINGGQAISIVALDVFLTMIIYETGRLIF